MTARTPIAAFTIALAVTLATMSSINTGSSGKPSATTSTSAGIRVSETTATAKEPEVLSEPGVTMTEEGTQDYLHIGNSAKDLPRLRPEETGVVSSHPSLYAGGTGQKIATVSFWEKLAYCETHADWENTGKYAGGLGIYVGTWRQWGGTQFSDHPSTATKSEQILVANRISTQGWLRPDGLFQRPVWFSGWGALGCAGRPDLVEISSPSAYTLEHSRMSN